jgi:TPR repeat protein
MFVRVDAIQQRRVAGHWLPIIRSLAVQGVPEAQYELGNIFSHQEWPGMYCVPQALFWYRQAIKQGHPAAMYNLAITYLNWGDMAGYRHWLSRAAAINPDDRDELKRFRTRFPHDIMRRWHRYTQER